MSSRGRVGALSSTLAAVTWIGCSSAAAPPPPPGPPPAPPPPPTGVSATIEIRGSGGVGDGITVAFDGVEVIVPPGEPFEHLLASGVYDIAVTDAPTWCEVDAVQTPVTVVTRQLTPVTIRADCVGGLAYTTTSDELHLLTTDGYDVSIAHGQGFAWLQSWAPDGEHFGFRAGAEMRLFELGTGRTISFPTIGTREDDLTWSPDGLWVAFHRGDTGPGEDGEIVVARRTGADLRPLMTDGGGPDAYPAWSPDGGTILFGSHRNSIDLTLHSVAPDGSALVEVDPRFAENPSWSRDGQWIAFKSFTPGLSINVIRPDASDRRVLAGGSSRFRWSPAGNVLAFGTGSSSEDLTFELYDVETDTRTVLLDLGGTAWIDWSGDGAWLAFTHWSGGVARIYIIRPDGSGMREILASPDRIRQVIWDPTVRQ